MKKLAILALAAAAAVASGSALARGRVFFGVGIGVPVCCGPFWGPPFSPWFAAPPATVVVVPAQPQRLVQQSARDRGSWWYYCESAQGYWPYVRVCPGGWQRISPTPPR